MTGWTRGNEKINALLREGSLDKIGGETASGEDGLKKAQRRLATAEAIKADDPESALLLAYEAVHTAGFALLAQQGLRPTRTGGHLAVEHALNAQFGGPMRKYGWLRTARHHDMYPAFPGERVDPGELAEALNDATAILDATAKILPELTMFR